MRALIQRAVHVRAGTTTKSVTFRRPFSLKCADGFQPAGTYVVETEEEAIPGLSFSPIAAYPQR
jgi:hypothetical protein